MNRSSLDTDNDHKVLSVILIVLSSGRTRILDGEWAINYSIFIQSLEMVINDYGYDGVILWLVISDIFYYILANCFSDNK